jgi:hypothetical protein
MQRAFGPVTHPIGPIFVLKQYEMSDPKNRHDNTKQ